jgi:hypothetical protein
MPIIPALRRLRQKNCEFKGRLSYIMRLYLKQTNRQAKNSRALSFGSSAI